MPLGKSASAGDWIRDFRSSSAPQFSGKSPQERQRMALGAYYANKRRRAGGLINHPRRLAAGGTGDNLFSTQTTSSPAPAPSTPSFSAPSPNIPTYPYAGGVEGGQPAPNSQWIGAYASPGGMPAGGYQAQYPATDPNTIAWAANSGFSPGAMPSPSYADSFGSDFAGLMNPPAVNWTMPPPAAPAAPAPAAPAPTYAPGTNAPVLLSPQQQRVNALAALGYGRPASSWDYRGSSRDFGVGQQAMQSLRSFGWDPSMGYGKQDWARIAAAQGRGFNPAMAENLDRMLYGMSPLSQAERNWVPPVTMSPQQIEKAKYGYQKMLGWNPQQADIVRDRLLHKGYGDLDPARTAQQRQDQIARQSYVDAMLAQEKKKWEQEWINSPEYQRQFAPLDAFAQLNMRSMGLGPMGAQNQNNIAALQLMERLKAQARQRVGMTPTQPVKRGGLV